MKPIFCLVAALFGVVIGGFANTLEYRTRTNLNILTNDCYCPSCGSKLRLTDQIPVVSYLLLGGRCRVCREKISPRYPLVEAGTTLIYGLSAFIFCPSVTQTLIAAFAVTAAGIAFSHKAHGCFGFSGKKLTGFLLLAAFQLPIAVGLMIVTL